MALFISVTFLSVEEGIARGVFQELQGEKYGKTLDPILDHQVLQVMITENDEKHWKKGIT